MHATVSHRLHARNQQACDHSNRLCVASLFTDHRALSAWHRRRAAAPTQQRRRCLSAALWVQRVSHVSSEPWRAAATRCCAAAVRGRRSCGIRGVYVSTTHLHDAGFCPQAATRPLVAAASNGRCSQWRALQLAGRTRTFLDRSLAKRAANGSRQRFGRQTRARSCDSMGTVNGIGPRHWLQTDEWETGSACQPPQSRRRLRGGERDSSQTS